MQYTKHQIRRIKQLNSNFFEVLFQKDSLNFIPGQTVTLYNGPDIPVFIASGVQEPWVRLIMNRDLSPNFPAGSLSVKLNLELDNKLPSLMAEDKPGFIFDTQTIGAFFSWSSTYPSKKCKVCYVGTDKISEDWIAANHTVISESNIKKMARVKNLYITGNRDLFNSHQKLLNKSTGVYLYD